MTELDAMKQDFKEFVERNAGKLVIGGLCIGYFGIKLYGAVKYRQGFITGNVIGFHATIDWFDKTFENLHLKEIYDNYAAVNPDKIANVKLK